MSQGADLNLHPDHDLPERGVFDPANASAEELRAFIQQLQAENAALKQQINSRQQADESRLRIVLENMPVMLFAIDTEGRCVAWNKESERVTGYSRTEMLGLKYELIEKLYPEPEYRQLLDQFWQENRGNYRNLELQIVAKNGNQHYIAWSDISSRFPVPGWAHWALGVDVTERKVSEEHSRILQELTAAFSEAMTTEDVANVIIQNAATVPGGAMGFIALLNEQEQTLTVFSGAPMALQDQFQTIPLEYNAPASESVRTGQPVLVETLQAYQERYPELSALVLPTTGTKAAAAFPMYFNNRVTGSIGITFTEERQLSPEEKQLIMALAYQCAQAVERARLYDYQLEARRNAELAQKRQTFLSDASKVLASSLDYDETLQKVAWLAVPTIADWCAVNMIREEGGREQLAVAHADPQKIAWVLEFQKRYPPDPDAKTGVPNVLRTGKSEFYPYIPRELLVAAAKDEEHLRLIDEVGITSAITVPLKTHDRVVGALTLVTAESGHHFTEADLSLAEELGRRAGIAIDNTHLYRAVQEQRERLHVTLSSIGDAVIATDMEQRITFMNNVAQALTGWDEDDAIGQPVEEVFHIISEATGDMLDNPVAEVIREDKIVMLRNHTLLLTRDGRVIPIDDSAAPIRDESGEAFGVILVFRDITRRRQIEAAEREQRNLADALRETAMALNHSLELSDVLDQILESLERVVPHDAANIMLIEHDTAQVVRSRGKVEVGGEHTEAAPRQKFDIEEVATLATMQSTQQPLVIPDTVAYPAWVKTTREVNSYAGVPIVIRGKVAGFLNVNSRVPYFFTEEHTERLTIFAAQAATAIQNAQLYEKAQQFAALEERQRLARDLHDAVSQTLFSSSIIAEALTRSKTPTQQEEMASHLVQLQRLNRGALAEMRTLLLELRAAQLSEIKITHLLTQLAEAVMGRTDLQVMVTVSGREKYPEAVHEMFYRVAQEALNNVAKHAKATQITITLTEVQGQAIFTIKDNGDGFNPAEIDPNHMGLSIMRERARTAGAMFQINSSMGQGTEVLIEWRIASEA